MSELNLNRNLEQEEMEGAPSERSEELFSMPDEACCSPEFPDGCVFSE